jgi:adenine/guanine phosphoribosyltransferase-like PRPP-binding protein
MKEVIANFHNHKLVPVKDRNFLINPLIDHVPTTPYELVEDAINELCKLTDFSKANKIAGEEDRGGFITALVAYRQKLPFGLLKWNPVGLDGQISVDFRNAYAEGKMYLNGVQKGDNVIIVEDLVDSGGTIIAMIELFKKAEVNIVDIIALAEKAEYKGVERIKKETGYEVKHLVKFTSTGTLSKVIWINGQGEVSLD